jgi:hypothetical protein
VSALKLKGELRGPLTTEPVATGRLLDHNVAEMINTTMEAGHRIVKAPIPSGRSGLKRSIKLDRARVSRPAARIHDSNHPLTELVEKPTKPHEIRPRGSVSDLVAGTARKALRFRVGGRWVYAKKVNHPGTRGKGSWKRADRYVRRHLSDNIKHGIDAALSGNRLSPISSSILGALQEIRGR